MSPLQEKCFNDAEIEDLKMYGLLYPEKTVTQMSRFYLVFESCRQGSPVYVTPSLTGDLCSSLVSRVVMCMSPPSCLAYCV